VPHFQDRLVDITEPGAQAREQTICRCDEASNVDSADCPTEPKSCPPYPHQLDWRLSKEPDSFVTNRVTCLAPLTAHARIALSVVGRTR
jgi:hypothetical protein